MGVLEEGGKAVGGVVDALRQNPLSLANLVLNVCFLIFLFYYVSIIAKRAESTVEKLFTAQDSVFKQWGVIVKDQQSLTEKMTHCILPEDALKLLQAPRAQPQNWPLYPLPKLTPLRVGPSLVPTPPAPLDLKQPIEQLEKPAPPTSPQTDPKPEEAK